MKYSILAHKKLDTDRANKTTTSILRAYELFGTAEVMNGNHYIICCVCPRDPFSFKRLSNQIIHAGHHYDVRTL